MAMKKLVIGGVLVAIVAFLANHCCHKEELFTYPETMIWGKSKPDTAITPFHAKIDKNQIDDLKLRLAQWRRHEPLPGVGYMYGLAGDRLDRLVKYWRESYDWSKLEPSLNTLPQFTTVIQGLRVHFLHAKADPKATKRIPLLLVHGWPGSVVEFYQTIPYLTAVDKNGTAFDVVAPSIPGYAFSEAASKPGFNPIAAAQLFNSLMKRLGYEKYVYQGGDWGSLIGNLQARIYPDNVVGFHTNFAVPPTQAVRDQLTFVASFLAPKLFFDKNEMTSFYDKFKLADLLEETGYFHIQATKPDTLGVALSDSPVGLASWIAEKFINYTQAAEFKGDPRGKGISNDHLLTNIMVYWFNNHVTSAGRLYKETVQGIKAIEAWNKVPHTVPTGVGCYPFEGLCAPKALLRYQMPKLVHYAYVERGGHFAACEEPKLFADDVRAAANAFYRAREQEQEIERAKKHKHGHKEAASTEAPKQEEKVKPATQQAQQQKQQQQAKASTTTKQTTNQQHQTTTQPPKQQQQQKTTTQPPKQPQQQQQMTTQAPKQQQTTAQPQQQQAKTTPPPPKPQQQQQQKPVQKQEEKPAAAQAKTTSPPPKQQQQQQQQQAKEAPKKEQPKQQAKK